MEYLTFKDFLLFESLKSTQRSDYDVKKIDDVEKLNVIKVFNHLIYIFIVLINRVKPNEIIFARATQKLEKFYRSLVNMKSVIRIFNECGYIYKGEDKKHRLMSKNKNNNLKTIFFVFVRK